MGYYPIFIELTERCCLVIGGGAVAERKVDELLAVGAHVTVISPTPAARKICVRERRGLEQSFEGRFSSLDPRGASGRSEESSARNVGGWFMRVGKVYLVGAGPGDPGLLTVRGLELLRGAQVIVYDQLVNPVLLEEASPAAIRIFVGKQAGRHCIAQEEINRVLIDYV